MLILQAFILWLMVSLSVIGGAVAFRRLFPQESPWFGFLIPPIALVIAINFIEHFLALPTLLFFAPALLGFTIWSLSSPRFSKEGLELPSVVFLASFAFTFGIRCLQPDISYTSDGLSDLNKINNFSQGGMLPPIDTWMPPYHFVWYYAFQHYAASVVKRLFHVNLGEAYNTTHALLSALTCVAGAAAAHRLSNGKLWITLATPLLIEAATTGTSAYLFLTIKDCNPWLADNLTGGLDTHPGNNWIWKLWPATGYHERLELQTPGFWTWRDEFHPNSSGHFLTLLAVFVMAEMGFAHRAIWPWVTAALIPALAVVSCAWALPITGLLCGGMVAIALISGRRPVDTGLTLVILTVGLILLWPVFYDVASSPETPGIVATQPQERAPFWEFVIQWWPIITLWICGCVLYRNLPAAIRWVMVVVPIILIGLEFIGVESRYDTVEKMWGFSYGVAFFALFPFVAQRAGIAYRLVTLVLLLSGFITFCGRMNWAWRWTPMDALFHLDGTHYITNDGQKKRIMETMAQVNHTTFLTGKCSDFCYYESPALGVFTENRSFLGWPYFESVVDYSDVAQARQKLTNDFYSGAMTNRLQFLQSNNITGVVIWPDDAIPNDFLAALTTELDPAYQYIDCRGNGDKNAGVFLLRTPPGKD
jgi:hypothetical protein